VLAYSQTVYDWLKTFHVVAAVIWVGGDVMLLVLARRIVRANDPRQKAAFVHDVGEVGQRFIAPTSLVVIAFALALVIYSPAWNFSDPWIAIAIAGYLATFVTGAFITGPDRRQDRQDGAGGHQPRRSRRAGPDRSHAEDRARGRRRAAADRRRHGAEAGKVKPGRATRCYAESANASSTGVGPAR
jgi:uncharacterized membrane protein